MYRYVLFIGLVMVTITATGCGSLKEKIMTGKLDKGKQQAALERAEYFANGEHDFIAELEANGISNIEWVRKDIEYMLYDMALCDCEDKATLVAIFEEIHAQEWESAKEEFLAFINSPDLMDFVMPRLREVDGYDKYSEDQLALIRNATYQYYNNKILNERSESYAQDRIGMVEMAVGF